MVAVYFEKAVAILLLVQNGYTIPVDDDKSYKYEEYIIEHEISSEQAKNSVLSTNVNSIVIPPGCQRCTSEEVRYCLGPDFINDHCCCDKRYHEYLPFIPHTCYIGTQLCKTIANDCTEYHRLRICCCQKHTLMKWKAKSNSRRLTSEIQKVTFILIYLYLFRLIF